MHTVSICVLLYGDHVELARRCLDSIGRSGPVRFVQDIRIALHEVVPETEQFVSSWTEQIGRQWDRSVFVYRPIGNRFKYPTMRRMIRHASFPVGEYVMWFDDDSYLSGEDDFWPRLQRQLGPCDMLGQTWTIPVQGKQLDWIKDQPWYDPTAGPPDVYEGKRQFLFCQGAWWVARTTMLLNLDWPIPELRHCGGDSLLGEVMRHTGYQMEVFDYGVRINADNQGHHSEAQRRGHNETPIGFSYSGQPLSRDHQRFSVDWSRIYNGHVESGCLDRVVKVRAS